MKTPLSLFALLVSFSLFGQMEMTRSFGVSSSLGQTKDPANMKYFSPAGNIAVDIALPVQENRSLWSFGLEFGLYSYVEAPRVREDSLMVQRREKHSSSNLSIRRVSRIYSWDRFGIYVPFGFYTGVIWKSTNKWTYRDIETNALIREDSNYNRNDFIAGMSIGLEFMFKTENGNFWYVGPYAYFRTNDLFSSFDEEFVGFNGGFRWTLQRD